jgi:hypothetical protein
MAAMNARKMISAFFSGSISRKAMLVRLNPLIIAALCIPIFIANLIFPTKYDWRYMVLSALSSPNDNPQVYLLPSIGMTIAGVLMIPFLGYYQKKLGKVCRGSTGVGTFFMFIAIFSMIGVSTISQVLVGVKNLHEIFAVLGFLGVILAGSFYGCPILKDRLKGAKQFDMRLYWAGILALWVPVIGLAVSQLYIAIVKPSWGYVGIQWITSQQVPVVMSLAFWEWLMFVDIIMFVVLLAVMVPETVLPYQSLKK